MMQESSWTLSNVLLVHVLRNRDPWNLIELILASGTRGVFGPRILSCLPDHDERADAQISDGQGEPSLLRERDRAAPRDEASRRASVRPRRRYTSSRGASRDPSQT